MIVVLLLVALYLCGLVTTLALIGATEVSAKVRFEGWRIVSALVLWPLLALGLAAVVAKIEYRNWRSR